MTFTLCAPSPHNHYTLCPFPYRTTFTLCTARPLHSVPLTSKPLHFTTQPLHSVPLPLLHDLYTLCPFPYHTTFTLCPLPQNITLHHTTFTLSARPLHSVPPYLNTFSCHTTFTLYLTAFTLCAPLPHDLYTLGPLHSCHSVGLDSLLLRSPNIGTNSRLLLRSLLGSGGRVLCLRASEEGVVLDAVLPQLLASLVCAHVEPNHVQLLTLEGEVYHSKEQLRRGGGGGDSVQYLSITITSGPEGVKSEVQWPCHSRTSLYYNGTNTTRE